jgi:hypothetical protein
MNLAKYTCCLLILFGFGFPIGVLKGSDLIMDSRISTPTGPDSLNKVYVIDQNDTIIFDFAQAVCTPTYILIPVSISTDDNVYAIDFALKFDPGEVTYHSFTNHKPYLNVASNYNAADSTVRFSSFSFSQPIESNSPLLTMRFNYGSVNQVSFATFDSVETQLNGDYCSKKGISANLTPPILPGGSPVLTPGDSIQLSISLEPGQTALWSNGATGPTTWTYIPGPYFVTVTNSQGCSGSASLFVSPPSPLPVELTDFTGKENGNGILLEWATASELNNLKFEIERLTKDLTWEVIGEVSGAGNSVVLKKYFFTDSLPEKGMNIYRLNQYDINGVSVHLSEIAIQHSGQSYTPFNLSLFPNPSNGIRMSVQVNSVRKDVSRSVLICDVAGRKLMETVLTPEQEGIISIEMEPERKLANGLYVVVYKEGEISQTTKFIVQ